MAFVSNADGHISIYTAADTAGAVGVRLSNTDANELQPAWSADYKKIAFVSFRDGNAEVYSMNANGTGVTRLTNTPGFDIAPVYSPDGKKIAFASERDGNGEIYVMNVDGTNVKRLTNFAGYDTDPTWSPDGTKIAFVSNRDAPIAQVYIMNATDGSGVTRFSPAGESEVDPHFSPDGLRIAFVAKKPNADVVMWRSVKQRNEPTQTTHEVMSANPYTLAQPTWSRDGLRMAFVTVLPEGQRYVGMDAFDSSKGILFKGTTGTQTLFPAWSR
jgi:tol-pal system beta propeller repeat protein TolB